MKLLHFETLGEILKVSFPSFASMYQTKDVIFVFFPSYRTKNRKRKDLSLSFHLPRLGHLPLPFYFLPSYQTRCLCVCVCDLKKPKDWIYPNS